MPLSSRTFEGLLLPLYYMYDEETPPLVGDGGERSRVVWWSFLLYIFCELIVFIGFFQWAADVPNTSDGEVFLLPAIDRIVLS